MDTGQALALAQSHLTAGRVAEAEAIYRQVVASEPGDARAVGLFALFLKQTGRASEAIELLSRAAAVAPGEAAHYYRLGALLSETGQFDPAAAALNHSLELRPDNPAAWLALASLEMSRDRPGEAIGPFRRVVSLAPDSADGWWGLTLALTRRDNIANAVESCRRFLTLRPNSAEGHNHLGSLLASENRTGDAVVCFRRAVALRPGFAEAHYNLGRALLDLGERDRAIEAFRAAWSLRPQVPELLNNLGRSFKAVDMLDEAVDAQRAALAIRPDFFEGLVNLGDALILRGELDGALQCYDQAGAIQPAPGIHGQPLFPILLNPRYTPEDVLREHRRWAARYADPLTRVAPPHGNERSPDRRLRVGYVSGDLRQHPLGMNMLPLMRNHDKSQVEVFCYFDAPVADAVTERFRPLADHWSDVDGWGDDRFGAAVRADQIDVLVDLAVHTSTRVLAFAQKPAPVQVTFAGYPGTTGMAAMDYRLTDPYLDPPDNDRWYTERSIRLPHTFWCYQSFEVPSPVTPAPALANGAVTFGCLNSFSRVNEQVLRLWAAVLRAVERSTLLLLAPQGSARRQVLDLLSREGVDPRRVTFTSRLSRADYLKLYHRIDLILDTFPYNGHTTSLDAMWMGVPLVTLVGQTAVGRAGFSHLSNLGLSDLAARTPEEFVTIAKSLAGDHQRLSALRSTLRTRMLCSPLTDAASTTRAIEAAFREMFAGWCGAQTR